MGYNQHKRLVPWTPELIARVAEMWKTVPAAEIARRIGYPGRKSAIVGKMHRLGLRAPHRRWGPHMTAIVRAPKKIRPAFILPGHRPKLRQGKPKAHAARLEPPVRVPAVANGTPFVETAYGQCRWIVTEWPAVSVLNTKCCGEKVVSGHSWCMVHCKMVYTQWAISRIRSATPPATLRLRSTPPADIPAEHQDRAGTGTPEQCRPAPPPERSTAPPECGPQS